MSVIRELRIGPEAEQDRRINLADLGFKYRVSDEARAEIEASERRAAKVLSTAHRFLFR